MKFNDLINENVSLNDIMSQIKKLENANKSKWGKSSRNVVRDNFFKAMAPGGIAVEKKLKRILIGYMADYERPDDDEDGYSAWEPAKVHPVYIDLNDMRVKLLPSADYERNIGNPNRSKQPGRWVQYWQSESDAQSKKALEKAIKLLGDSK